MLNSDVLIGLAGDLVPQSKIKDIASTRVGGPSVYPANCNLPDADLLKCSTCKGPLSLMLSAYTPLSNKDIGRNIEPRYLYVYCCTAEGCKGQNGSWRALRYQQTNKTNKITTNTSSQKPEKNQFSKPDTAITHVNAADTWGFADIAQPSEFGDSRLAPVTNTATTDSNTFEFGDLCSALDALEPSTKPTVSTKQKDSSNKSSEIEDTTLSAAAIVALEPHAKPCLPAFYLHAQPESQVIKGFKGSKIADNNEEDEDEDDVIGGIIKGQGTAKTTQHDDDNSTNNGNTGDGEAWDGEKYEADSVIVAGGRSGPDAAYLKFARQLWRCPEQCARYSFNGSLLWPENKLPTVDACPLCGAARVFEVQLMTPVISMLDESADWLKEDTSLASFDVIRPPSTWEWATAAVFTCSKSCDLPAEQGGFTEEAVSVANES